ncbi:hypothetical protein AQUCO_05500109v1 [Aquilegia coerulea]|uniref:Uncharacterized protein n=1 Tax=Aquilegia coerulea TaxID=218851 RepID=A0A2G5CGZ5_AQUCA|nr:hypothetical protein AQUCO_05500109v1 [Aquilegia coerulea]
MMMIRNYLQNSTSCARSKIPAAAYSKSSSILNFKDSKSGQNVYSMKTYMLNVSVSPSKTTVQLVDGSYS